jgi:hypothetical protein
MLAGWLVDWLVGWLVGWFVGWLLGWLVIICCEGFWALWENIYESILL